MMTLGQLESLLGTPGRAARPPSFEGSGEAQLERFAAGFRAVFDAAPVLDPAGHLEAWDRLREHAHEVYDGLAPHFDIRFEPPAPGLTPAELRVDLLEHGRLVITTEHCEHPCWSVEDNCKYRVVHDVITHVLYDRPFSLVGEVLGFHDHLRFAPIGSEQAVFTEVFVYAAIYYTHGSFPTRQKACAFPQLHRQYLAEFPS